MGQEGAVIYLVRRTDTVGEDETAAVVVRAPTKMIARHIAAGCAQDEGRDIWFASSTVVQWIPARGPQDVILVGRRDA
jgi:hypothetical protein